MVDDLLTTKEVGQLNNIVDIVAVLYIVRLVYHPNIVENVVFSDHKL